MALGLCLRKTAISLNVDTLYIFHFSLLTSANLHVSWSYFLLYSASLTAQKWIMTLILRCIWDLIRLVDFGVNSCGKLGLLYVLGLNKVLIMFQSFLINEDYWWSNTSFWSFSDWCADRNLKYIDRYPEKKYFLFTMSLKMQLYHV